MVAWDSSHSKSPFGPHMKICFPNASPNDYENEYLLTFQDPGFHFETTKALVGKTFITPIPLFPWFKINKTLNSFSQVREFF